MERVFAKYRIETPLTLEQAAEALAGEQSSGTFVAVPGETEAIKERFRARVEHIDATETVSGPALPGARGGRGPYARGIATVSWSIENFGPSLPNLWSTLCGNLWELRQFSGIKLIDIELPPAFAAKYPGPQFGIEGTRRLSQVFGRPLIGTIIKPSVGLSAEDTAELVERLVEAGVDFIKDDELTANPPHAPLQERVMAVMKVINRHAERTGKKVMYAFNITDDMDAMLAHHDVVLEAGGTCVMAVMSAVGLTGFAHLRKRCSLPIHGHRAGWGLYDRSPWLGLSYLAYHKLWRLAGADHLHVCGLRNKFYESDNSVVASARACLEPLFDREGRADLVMPVISSAQWAGQARDTYDRIGSSDLIYCAGGGIMAHPMGVAAGVLSIRQGWEAALEQEDIGSKAARHPELASAIETFGNG